MIDPIASHRVLTRMSPRLCYMHGGKRWSGTADNWSGLCLIKLDLAASRVNGLAAYERWRIGSGGPGQRPPFELAGARRGHSVQTT